MGFHTCQNKFQHCISCFFRSMFYIFLMFAFLYFCSSCIHFTFMALIIYRIIYQVSLKKILNKKKEYTCNGESIIGIVSAKRDLVDV